MKGITHLFKTEKLAPNVIGFEFNDIKLTGWISEYAKNISIQTNNTVRKILLEALNNKNIDYILTKDNKIHISKKYFIL
jgi:hypothetical protein